MPSRSEIISQLKSRGTKGKLSKMKKAELQDLLQRTAPPQLELEPDEQSGNGKGTYKEFMKAHLLAEPVPGRCSSGAVQLRPERPCIRNGQHPAVCHERHQPVGLEKNHAPTKWMAR